MNRPESSEYADIREFISKVPGLMSGRSGIPAITDACSCLQGRSEGTEASGMRPENGR